MVIKKVAIRMNYSEVGGVGGLLGGVFGLVVTNLLRIVSGCWKKCFWGLGQIVK